MNAIVFEHIKVSDLPEAWREKLAASEDARVTVRIEQEAAAGEDATTATTEHPDDPLFGMWRDREEMTDVAGYVRKLRAPRS